MLRWVAHPGILSAAVVALAGAFGTIWITRYNIGWNAGHAARSAEIDLETQQRQKELFRLREESAVKDAALARQAATNDELLTRFEDAARSDPGAAVRRPDADSMRQIRELFDAARRTP